jgi:hypothetical protein
MYRASFIILYYDQQVHNLFHKISHSYMFRHYRVILRELVINTLPSYTSISDAAVGNTIYIKVFHTGFMQVLIL